MELGRYREGGINKSFTTERSNFLLVGKTQTGKSQTLIRLVLDDIHNGKKVIFIGDDSTDEVLKHIPNDRQEETIYFNPSIQPFGFNPLANVPVEKHKALANSIIDTIHTLLTYDGSTPTLDDYLRVGVLTLLKYNSSSLLSLYFLLTNKKERKSIEHNVQDDFLEYFWERFETLTPKEQRQDVSSTINKLSVFVFDPILRNCLSQPDNYISLDNPITLVSLNDVDLGADSSAFLGALVIASLTAQDSQNITVYIDDASKHGSRILAKLLQIPTVTTVMAVRSLQEFHNLNDVLKSTEVIPLCTSPSDAKILDSVFTIYDMETRIDQLPYFKAVVPRGSRVREIDLFQHEYEVPKKPRNTKKPVEKRIIDRCSRQCTLSDKKIKLRLGEFFE